MFLYVWWRRAEANESHKNNCVLKSTQNVFKYHFANADDDDDGVRVHNPLMSVRLFVDFINIKKKAIFYGSK